MNLLDVFRNYISATAEDYRFTARRLVGAVVAHFAVVRVAFQSSHDASPIPRDPVAGYVTVAPVASMKEK